LKAAEVRKQSMDDSIVHCTKNEPIGPTILGGVLVTTLSWGLCPSRVNEKNLCPVFCGRLVGFIIHDLPKLKSIYLIPNRTSKNN